MGKQSRARRERAQQPYVAATVDKKRSFVLYTIAGVVALLVLGIITTAVVVRNSPEAVATAEGIDSTAQIPRYSYPYGDTYQYGVTYLVPEADVPTVVLWEDFQCPGCGAFEKTTGAMVDQLAREGKARFVWRNASFLDERYPGEHSQRATAAWGCAQDVDKGSEYHAALYATQPPTEGAGWTDEELIQLGVSIGMNEEDYKNFSKCVNAKSYMPWAKNITETFYNNGIEGTPTVLLNGVPMAQDVLMDPAKFAEAIQAATPTQSAAPSTPASAPAVSPTASASPSETS